MSDTDQDFIDFRDILSILRRQSRRIVLTTLIFMSIAFVYLTRATPLYTATALVKVDTAGKDLLMSVEQGINSSSTDNARMESEVEILGSDSLALETIRGSQLYLDDEFGASLGLGDRVKIVLGMQPSAPPTGEQLLQTTLGGFKEALDVRRRGLTYLIAVSFTSENPARAAELANAHATTYINRQLQSKVEDALAGRDLLQAQLQTAQQNLAGTDGALTAYVDNNMDRLVAEAGTDATARLREQIASLDRQRNEVLERQLRAQEALATGDFASLAQEVGDAAILRLQEQQDALQQQLGAIDADSPQAIDLKSGLDKIEDQLANMGTNAVSSIGNEVSGFDDRGAQLRDSLQSALLSSSLSPQTLTEIYGLQQEAQIAQQQYDTLLQRMREIETQALIQIADSRVVSEALPPQAASFPKKKLVLLMALMLGLGGGIAIGLLHEYFVGGVTSASQLANIVPQRVAGVVPRVDATSDSLTIADKVVDEPMSLVSESFRRIRATIDRQVPDVPGRGKVIMVTSSIPAEGKSTDALALARTYAQAGKRTLLIDADLRNPSLHKFIGTETNQGILEYLLGEIEADEPGEFYDADPKSKLGIIMGRRRSMVPTDAPLQSTTFQELIANARNALDVIIIDTAPLVPVVDARYIAPHVDMALLCVRFGVTKQVDLRMSYEQLMDSIGPETKVMTILNCFERNERAYRYTGYYGYGEK